MPTHELITSISAGKCHSMALTINGDAYSWGKNWYGELGTGDTDLTPTPVLIGRNKSSSSSMNSSSESNLLKGSMEEYSRIGSMRSKTGNQMTTRGSTMSRGVSTMSHHHSKSSTLSRAGTANQDRALLTTGIGGGNKETITGEKGGMSNLIQSKRKSTITSEKSSSELEALNKLDNIDMSSGPVFLRLSGGDRHSVSLGLRGRPEYLKRENISARGVKGLR